jgi:hypothetical protein
VLPVRELWRQRHRTLPKLLEEGREGSLCRFRIGLLEPAQPIPQHPSDASADRPVGQVAGLGPPRADHRDPS